MIKLRINIFDEDVAIHLRLKSDLQGVRDTYNALKELDKKTTKTASSISTSLKNVFTAAGITASIAGITKSIKKAVTDAANYEESLNLFHMALKDYYQDGLKWSRKIADALYLDDSQILQYTGSFFNLTKGLGASSDAAYLMSKNLTQLTYDMSSYLNIDVSTANTKLMSAMSGQTKAVTSVGIAVQQASLQELAYSMGIQKSVRDMTQAEKTYLRYIQIIKSTKNMQGDLARTIITPTNAFRMLSTQVVLLGRAIGQVLTPLIYKLMPMLIALTRVITDAAKQLAGFFGYQIQDIDYGGVEGLTDSIKDLGKEVDKTSAKAHRMLAPFDQLNVVESASGGGGGGSTNSVLDELAKQLEGYDMLEDLNKKMQSSIEDWENKIRGLGPVILGIAGIISAIKIGKFLTGIGNGITNILDGSKLVGTAFEGMGATIGSVISKVLSAFGGVTIAISGIAHTWHAATDTMQNDTQNMVEMSLGAVGTVVGSAITGAAIFGPAGAVGGAILGLAGFFTTVTIGANQMIENLALEQLNQRLGTVKVSTEEWLDTLLGSSSTLMEVVAKIDEFNKSIQTNTETFNTAVGEAQNDILLYSTSVGEYAVISNEMLTTITSDMEKLSTSSSNGIKDYTDKNLLLLKDQYATASDEEKKLLDFQMTQLTKHSEESQKEISTNKEAIKKIYAKANKEHRNLTSEEYTQVQEHLNKMSAAYYTFTKEGKDTLSKYFDESGKLRDGYNYDSINNFIEAKKKYYEEVEKASDKEYAEYEKHFKHMLDAGEINQEKYDNYMKIADKKRKEDLRTAQETIDTYSQKLADGMIDVYSDIEKETGTLSTKMRGMLEDTFKKLNIDTNPIQKSIDEVTGITLKGLGDKNQFKEAAKNGIYAYTSELTDRMNKTKLVAEISSITSSNGKTITLTPKIRAIQAKADGGYLDQGDLFVANEAGPEFITSIGNKSAVINQGQMVAALSNAIITATGNRAGSQPQNIVVQIGNEKIYEGHGEYQNRQNDRYGTTVVKI